MPRLPVRLVVPLFAVVAFRTTTAVAQAPSGADAAFERGLADMKAGRYETGCPSLAESYRLDPQAGALFTLATCEARWGKAAASLKHFEEYLRLFKAMSPSEAAQQKGRDKIAAGEMDKLEPKVARLTVALPASAPEGTSVELDGTPLDPRALETAMIVEPAEHVLVTKSPGRVATTRRVKLDAEDRIRIEVTVGGESGAPGGAPGEAGGQASGSHLVWALVAGGVGVVGLGLGAVTGAMVLGEKSTIDEHCTDAKRCDDDGLSAVDRAQTLGLLSTIGFGVGIAGAAAALVLIATEPASPASASRTAMRLGVRASPGGGQAWVTGVW